MVTLISTVTLLFCKVFPFAVLGLLEMIIAPIVGVVIFGFSAMRFSKRTR